MSLRLNISIQNLKPGVLQFFPLAILSRVQPLSVPTVYWLWARRPAKDHSQKIILCKRSFSAKDHSQDVPQVENFGHKLKSDQNFVLCPPFPFLFIIIIICKLMLAPRVASNRNTSFKVKLCTQQQQTPKGRGCCS